MSSLRQRPHTELMTTRDVLSIVVPVVALAAVLFLPGELRWSRRPWFVAGAPGRGLLAAFCGALLIVAIVHAAV